MRIVCTATSILLLLMGCSTDSIRAPIDTQYAYTTNNNAITIVRYIGAGSDATVPHKINGLSVTRIGSEAFAFCTNITNITFPNSVTSIENVFRGCAHLTKITVEAGNSVYQSMDGVLYNKNLTTLLHYPQCKAGPYTMPNSVTSLGEDEFWYCTRLTAITVNNNNSAYRSQDGVLYNKSLTSLIKCPEGSKNGRIVVPDGVDRIENGALFGCTNLTNISIPNSVTSIGSIAFVACSNLTSITIPNNVTNIGMWAFMDCTSLTNFTIPPHLTNYYRQCFGSCIALTAIAVDANNPSFSSVEGILFDKSQKTLIEFPGGKTTIPDGFTSIGSYAFSYCDSLSRVTIPNSVTTIGAFAFFGCSNLTSITIPTSVTSIEHEAFANCKNLTKIYFLGNAPKIGEDIFMDFPNSTPVTVYYQPGTTGWGQKFGGRPTAVWTGAPSK